MYTTFFYQPQQAAVRTYIDTVYYLLLAYNKPSITILSGKSQVGPQHNYKDATLKFYSIIKVIDLIGDNKGNKPYINSCANYIKNRNNNIINNFLSFKEILYKKK